MDAYLCHLAAEISAPDFKVSLIPTKNLTDILRGKYRETPSRPYFFSKNNIFREASVMIGANLVGGNHWTLVIINFATRDFIFMDPKADMATDYQCSTPYLANWKVFCKCWNRDNGTQNMLPTNYNKKVFPHALQPPEDNNNCGIYTLMVSRRCF